MIFTGSRVALSANANLAQILHYSHPGDALEAPGGAPWAVEARKEWDGGSFGILRLGLCDQPAMDWRELGAIQSWARPGQCPGLVPADGSS
jgi:hypothetical protein